MYYQLHDSETQEILGTVKVLNVEEAAAKTSSDELWTSWEQFNKLEEHELCYDNVDDFVEWNNENFLTMIERITLEFIQI